MNPSRQLSGRRSQGHPRWKRHGGDASTGTSQGHISKGIYMPSNRVYLEMTFRT